MRPIDADDLISRMHFIQFEDGADRSLVYALIEMQPTADVVERKKGKWVYEKINSYTSRTYCSECGNAAPSRCVSDDYYGVHMHGEINKTKFCPNCGAQMEVE